MNLPTRAAAAAGFALTLMLSVNCNFASAQQAASPGVATSTYQTPSAVTVSMADAPAAPTLQGASCGTIGPQPDDTVVVPINAETADSVTVLNDGLTTGKFDGGQFLRNFSSDLDQFKGKIAEKAFSFLESIQNAGRKDSAVVAPGGYSVIRQPASVSPAVF